MSNCTIDPKTPWKCGQTDTISEPISVDFNFKCLEYDMCLTTIWGYSNIPCYVDGKRISDGAIGWYERGKGIYRTWVEDEESKAANEKKLSDTVSKLEEQLKNKGSKWTSTSSFRRYSWVPCGPSAGGGYSFRTSQCQIMVTGSLTLNCKTSDYFEVTDLDYDLADEETPPEVPEEETIPAKGSCYHTSNLPTCPNDEYNNGASVDVVQCTCPGSRGRLVCESLARRGGGQCIQGVIVSSSGPIPGTERPRPQRDIRKTLNATVKIKYTFCK